MKDALKSCFTDPDKKDEIQRAVVEAIRVEPAPEEPLRLGTSSNRSWQLGYMVACLMSAFPEHWDEQVDYWATGVLESARITAGRLSEKVPFIARQAIRDTCVFGPNPLADVETPSPPNVRFRRHAVSEVVDLLAPGSPMSVEGEFGEFKLGRCATGQARAAIENVERLKRFLPEATVARGLALSTVEDFLTSASTALAIVAPSGAGKTSLLAQLALRHAERSLDRPTLFFPALNLDETRVDRQILQGLGFSDSCSMGDFLSRGNRAASLTDGRRIVVLVDALDEHPRREELVRQLALLIADAHMATRPKWLKVIVSVRDTVYANVGTSRRLDGVRGHAPYFWPPVAQGGLRDFPALTLGRFDEAEAEVAFQRYLDREEPQSRTTSTWSDLEGTPSARVLTNPLYMRLLVEAYRGRAIPPAVHWSQVEKEYYDRVVCERGKPRPEREDPTGEWDTLARQLATALEEKGGSWLDRGKLVSAGWFHRRAFDQLVSLGVLVDVEQRVAFRDAHILAYVLSLCLEERASTVEGLRALSGRACECPGVPLQDALVAILIRQCSQGHVEEFVRLIDGADPLTEPGKVALAACEEALGALARDGAASGVLAFMTRVPSQTDAEVLMHVAESLELGGFTEPALSIVAACCDETIRLDMPNLAARAECLRASLLLTEQRLDEATRAINNAMRLAPKDSATLEAQLRLGEVLRHQKEWAKAQDVCLEVIRTAGASDRRILGNAYRSLGVVVGTIGRPEEELTHYKKAIELLEECGDTRGTAHCKNNLAIFAKGSGRWEEAIRLYEEAWNEYQSSGDRVDMGMIAMNRGWLHKDRGELGKAESWYLRGLRLAVAVSSYLQMANRESSLGELLEIKGDLAGARRHYLRSMQIWEEHDEAGRDTALILRAFGRVSLRLGRLRKARWLFETEKQMAVAENNKERLMYASLNLGRLEEWAGDHDRAMEALEDGLAHADRFGFRMSLLFGLASCSIARRDMPASARYVSEYETLAGADGIEPLFQRRARLLRVRLGFLAGALEVSSDSSVLRALNADWDAWVGCFHPEDGPAAAYLDGGRALFDAGHPQEAREWLEAAMMHVSGRPWYPWEDERVKFLKKALS